MPKRPKMLRWSALLVAVLLFCAGVIKMIEGDINRGIGFLGGGLVLTVWFFRESFTCK